MKFMVPLSRSLLESIDGFSQFANYLAWVSQLKVFILRHINCFVNVSTEKCCLNIHLMKLKIKMCNQCHDCPIRVFRRNWRESLFKVNPFILSVTICHKTSLISFASRLVLNIFLYLQVVERVPKTYCLARIILFIHCFNPFLRVSDFHGLMEVDQIILHYTIISIVFLKEHNIIIQICIFPLSNKSS